MVSEPGEATVSPGSPTAGSIMRTEFVVVSPDTEVVKLASLMITNGQRALPVMEDEELIGIVTEYDLITREADVEVPSVFPFLDALFVADAGRDFDEDMRHVLATTAADLMSSPVQTINAEASLGEVATVMIERGVSCLPVTATDSSLLGIVSRAELIQLVADLDSAD